MVILYPSFNLNKYKTMFELYLKNRNLSSFQADSLQEILNDFVIFSAENDKNAEIDRIEQIGENDEIIQIILGKEIQDDLDLQIQNARQDMIENEDHLSEMGDFLNSQK